ncbi:hypothetical protein AAW14_24815 [Streptomyces hygroscopicus]|nr:hypothetical protein [Streptomyces hygroscopicus]
MDALQLGAQGTALQGQDMSLLREDMFNVPYVEEASTRQTRVGRVEQLFKLHDIAREYLDETRQAERLVAAALSRITGTPSRTRQASAGTGAPAGASAAEKSRRGPSR